MSVLLYGCTTWTLLKHLEKKLNGNHYFEWILEVVTHWAAVVCPLTSYLTNHLSKISKTYWALLDKLSKEKHTTNILLWTPTHGHTSVSRPAKSYIHWLCVDTGWCLENLLSMMTNRDGWQDSERNLFSACIYKKINSLNSGTFSSLP